MIEFLRTLPPALLSTVFDVAPIVAVLTLFQVFVLRRRLPNLRRTLAGLVCVLLGLALFLVGLENALFPIGETMAFQLTAHAANGAQSAAGAVDWTDYLMVYLFGAAIGFATTVAEPSLIAVAIKAEQVSGGTVRAWPLRIAVAVGVAIGVSLGCFPHRHRHPTALVHHRRLRHRHRADLPVQPHHHTPGLRQRRRHHVNRHGAGGCRVGPGSCRQHPGTQPAD